MALALALAGASPALAAPKKPASKAPPVRKPVPTTVKRAATTTTVKRPATTTSLPATTTAARLAEDLFTRVNQERANRGVGPLTWDPTLATLAGAWSAKLSTGAFEHRDLKTALDLAEFEPFSSLGENIAKMPRRPDMGRELHQAWMRSDPHRTNLLQPSWDSIGIGVVCDAKGNAWATQNFGRHTGTILPGPISATPPLAPTVATAPDGLSC